MTGFGSCSCAINVQESNKNIIMNFIKVERQTGFAPVTLEFCRLFLWASQALTHLYIVTLFYSEINLNWHSQGDSNPY